MTGTGGQIAPSGRVAMEVHRAGQPSLRVVPYIEAAHPSRELSTEEIIRYGCPQRGLPPAVNEWRRKNLTNLWRGARRVLAARTLRLPHFYGQLWLTLHSTEHGDLDLGLASMRVVTDTGVGYIVDAFQNIVELENMKFHGFGTGTGVEAAGDTALGTELTTQYATDSTRPTGTTIEGATGNIFRTVATVTPDSGFTIAVTEHGVFSANAAGVLLDRSKFAAVNLVAAGDAITATYDLTLTSGS